MTHIASRKFYDDVDNHQEIKCALKRKRYNKSFECLYSMFYIEKVPWISSSILQERMCISDHSTAYQILSSFAVLNLLKKEKRGHRRVFFFPTNEKWWYMFNKHLKKGEDGSK